MDDLTKLRTDLAAMTERAEKAEWELGEARLGWLDDATLTSPEADAEIADMQSIIDERDTLRTRLAEVERERDEARDLLKRADAALKAREADCVSYDDDANTLRTALASAEATIARIASAVFEPVTLPDGCPPLVDRIIGAIEQLAQERTDARSGEHAAIERAMKMEAEIAKMREAIDDVSALIDESSGVYGLHLNGGPAPWSDLLSGGRHEEWLARFDAARKEVG